MQVFIVIQLPPGEFDIVGVFKTKELARKHIMETYGDLDLQESEQPDYWSYNPIFKLRPDSRTTNHIQIETAEFFE